MKCEEKDCKNNVCSELGSEYGYGKIKMTQKSCCVCGMTDREDMCEPCKPIFKEIFGCPECKGPCSSLYAKENARKIDGAEAKRCCNCICLHEYAAWYCKKTEPTYYEEYYQYVQGCEWCEDRVEKYQDSDGDSDGDDAQLATKGEEESEDISEDKSDRKRKLSDEKGEESGKVDQKKQKK